MLSSALLSMSNAASTASSLSPFFYKDLDFETGDLSQWANCVQVPDGTTDRLQVIENSGISPPSPDGGNKYALKATLKAGDFDKETNGARAEVVLCEIVDQSKKLIYFNDGDIMLYHWYTMFPSNFTMPGGRDPEGRPFWAVWTQWHGALDASSFGVPVGFNINNKGTTPVLNLRVNGSYYDSIQCYDITAGKCGYLWVEPLQSSKGKWLDIYLLIKWSTKKEDGFVQGIINGKRTEMYQGYTLNPSDPADAKVYLKQGLYHNKYISQTQIVYHDSMKIVGYHRSTL